MGTKKIARAQCGNRFNFCFRVRMAGGSIIDPSVISDMEIKRNNTVVDHEVQGEFVVIEFEPTLNAGPYSLTMTGKIDGREIRDAHQCDIVLTGFGDGIEADSLESDFWIICQPDDTIDAIAAALNTAKAAATASKAAADAEREMYAEKVSEIDGLAKESNATANKIEILSAISTGGGITPEQYAALAKSSDLQTATAKLTALQTQVGEFEEGESAATELAKISNKIGSPAESQPQTIFEAIAAGGSGGTSSIREVTTAEIEAIVDRVIS